MTENRRRAEKEKVKTEMCTVARNLEIVPGTRADYESLSHYHYREPNMGPYAAIFAMKGKFRTATKLETVGVIVYSMPTAGRRCEISRRAGFSRGWTGARS